MTCILKIGLLSIVFLAGLAFHFSNKETLELEKNTAITLIDNNLASRMMDCGTFETEPHIRYPN